jgi:hypothetical protein
MKKQRKKKNQLKKLKNMRDLKKEQSQRSIHLQIKLKLKLQLYLKRQLTRMKKLLSIKILNKKDLEVFLLGWIYWKIKIRDKMSYKILINKVIFLNKILQIQLTQDCLLRDHNLQTNNLL